jgi:hypothetical protein
VSSEELRDTCSRNAAVHLIGGQFHHSTRGFFMVSNMSSVVHLTRDASLKLIDSQRAIWLAGLGAK